MVVAGIALLWLWSRRPKVLPEIAITAKPVTVTSDCFGPKFPNTVTNRTLVQEARENGGPDDWCRMGWPSPCGPSDFPGRYCPDTFEPEWYR